MALKSSIRPAALLGLTLAAVLATGCQSTPSGMGSSGASTSGSVTSPGMGMGAAAKEGVSPAGSRATSSTGATTMPNTGPANAGTGTSTDSGRAADK